MRRPVNNALVLGVLLATVGVGQPTFAQMVMAGGPDMTVDAAAKTELIQSLVKGLREAYVFPDVGEKLAHMLLNRQVHGEYDSITSAKALSELLTKQLYEVAHDKHLAVNYHSQTIPPMPAGLPQGISPTFLRMLKKGNFGFEKVERLSGNIGYLQVKGFIGSEVGGAVVEGAMRFLANTDALIVDLRDNHGGEPQMVGLLASYFFSGDPVHLNDLAYRRKGTREYDINQSWTQPYVPGLRYADKEIYILTSNQTFSAAEEFAYDLQALKRATVVGETTGGGANPGDPYRLTAHFASFIPNGYASNPVTKTNWEGVGVKPDIAVSQADALKTARKAALEHLMARTTDPDQRAQLKMALNGVGTSDEAID